MKLYMKQSAFQWGVPLPLLDKSGKTRYTVTGDAYSLGKRLRISDLAGREAVYIRQTIPSLFPRYEIEVYGKPVAEIVKDLTFFRPRCTIESLGWDVIGILRSCDYELSWQGSVVASSRPQQSQTGNVLVLEFCDRTTELTALGVMVAINCMLASQESTHL